MIINVNDIAYLAGSSGRLDSVREDFLATLAAPIYRSRWLELSEEAVSLVKITSSAKTVQTEASFREQLTRSLIAYTPTTDATKLAKDFVMALLFAPDLKIFKEEIETGIRTGNPGGYCCCPVCKKAIQISETHSLNIANLIQHINDKHSIGNKRNHKRKLELISVNETGDAAISSGYYWLLTD